MLSLASGALAIAAAAMAVATLAPGSTTGSEGVSAAVTTGGQRTPCANVEVSGYRARGGCRLVVGPGKLRFTALSIFGDEPLGRCPVRLRMRVGRSGELGIAQVSVSVNPAAESGPLGAGCGDTHACWRDARRADVDDPTLAWDGQVLRGDHGGLEARIDMCFDTCLGRFEGSATLALTPTAHGGWRLRARRAALGTSGLELTGSLPVEPTGGGRLTFGRS